MKYIYKYIFATIIILLLTSTLEAAPKVFKDPGHDYYLGEDSDDFIEE